MTTIYQQIEGLSKAVTVLEEELKEAEKIENPFIKRMAFVRLNFLKNKLKKRAEELDALVRSGKAFE